MILAPTWPWTPAFFADRSDRTAAEEVVLAGLDSTALSVVRCSRATIFTPTSTPLPPPSVIRFVGTVAATSAPWLAVPNSAERWLWEVTVPTTGAISCQVDSPKYSGPRSRTRSWTPPTSPSQRSTSVSRSPVSQTRSGGTRTLTGSGDRTGRVPGGLPSSACSEETGTVSPDSTMVSKPIVAVRRW